MAITSDAKFIATLSASQPQVLAIWEWTTDSDAPVCAVEIGKSRDLQTNLKFNSENIFQLVSNSGTQIVFYEWSFEQGLKYYEPAIDEKVNSFFSRFLCYYFNKPKDLGCTTVRRKITFLILSFLFIKTRELTPKIQR